jgi:hypothetical protein
MVMEVLFVLQRKFVLPFHKAEYSSLEVKAGNLLNMFTIEGKVFKYKCTGNSNKWL